MSPFASSIAILTLPGFAVKPTSLSCGRSHCPTDRWISQQLSPYGIKPRLLRIGGDLGRGYLEEGFSDTLRRYASKAEFEALYLEAPTVQPKPDSNGG